MQYLHEILNLIHKGLIKTKDYKLIYFVIILQVSLAPGIIHGQSADAGADQIICTDHTILDGNNPGGGTGTWTVKVGAGTGTFVNPNQYDSEVQEASFGPNVYIWELVKNGNTTTDEVTITSWASYAGENKITCVDSIRLRGANPAEIPGGASGMWTTTGSATIVDPTNYNTWVKDLETGDNWFKWTITYTDPSIFDDPASCSSTHDEVNIYYTGTGLANYNLSAPLQYCPGSSGVTITLNGSEADINYQLYKNNAALGAALAGTGNPLTWDNMTAGEYTVEAYSTTSTCYQPMPDTITISTYPELTSYDVEGTATFCAGGSGGTVTLSGSTAGIDYQLVKDAAAYGTAKTGTGSPLDWTGLPQGTYTVTASDANCSKDMNGSLNITETPLPTVFNVSGTGSYCSGSSGLAVSLDGSEIDFKYYLLKDGSKTDSIFGTGGPLNWPGQFDGTYAVQAKNPVTGCTNFMNGTAVITANPLPTDYNLSGPTGYCAGATGITLTLSGSQSGGNYQYQLIKNDVNHLAPKTGTGSSLSWSGLKHGSYWVLATNTTTGCSAIMPDTVNVSEYSLPAANAGDDEDICYGSSTMLTATGGTSYLWYPGGYSGASYMVSPSDTTEYRVKVTDANGCINWDTVIVNVSPLPLISAGNDKSICAGENAQLNASGGETYSWSPATGLNSTNIANPLASPSNTTTYTVEAWDDNGCSNTDQVTVTVKSNPVANAGNDVEICDGDTTLLTASGGGTYLWSTGETTASIEVAPSSTTTYLVTVENANGCTDTDDVIVTVNAKPTANAGSDKAICEGTTTTLTATGGATYLWSNGATTQSINVTPIVTTTYTVTAISAAGCQDKDDIKVTVNPNPTVDAGMDQEICKGENANLTATPSVPGVDFLWNPGGDVTQSITVNPETTTDYTVKITDGNGCENQDMVRVIVNPLPVVSINNLDADYCADEPDFTITGIPTGTTGIFSPTPGLTDNGNGTAVFSPTSVPNGTNYNISYEYTDGNGCVNSITETVLVRNETSPSPVFTNLEPVYCDDDNTNYLIVADPADGNGTFSGPAAALTDNGDGTADFNPSLTDIGTYSIDYSYTDPITGCEGTVSQSVEVGVPLEITNLDSFYCEDVGPFLLTADKPGGTFTVDGAYSAPEGTATFDPSTIGTGLHTVTYELTNGISCSNSNTREVRVYALPDASFTLDGLDHESTELKYCSNHGLITLEGDPNPGGIFTSPDGGVSGNKYDPFVAGSGTHKIYYTYTTSKGCASTDSAIVHVEEAPTVTINGLDPAYCNSTGIVEIAGNPLNSGGTTPVPGTWTSPWADPLIFNDKNNGKADFNPSLVPSEGTYTISYTVEGSNGCIATASQMIDVNFLPTVTFTGLPTEICKNSTPVSLTGNPKSSDGSFSGPGITDNGDGTAVFDPSGLPTIAHNITYNYTDPVTTCTNQDTKSVTVKPIPALYTVTGGGNYCEGGAGVDVGLSQSEIGVTYSLVLDNVNTISSIVGDGNPVDFGLQTSEGTYTVKAANPAPNSCERTMEGSATIVINPLPGDAQPISGPTEICPLTAANFSVPSIPNATSYSWTLPAGASITNGSGTRNVTIFFGSGSVSGTISVKGNNSCGSGSQSNLNITIKSLPGAAGVITGSNMVCQGEKNVNYTIAEVTNTDYYNWELPSGASLHSGDGTKNVFINYNEAALPGNITVTPVNACGSGTSSSIAVDVIETPDISITPPAEEINCTGNQITLSGTSSTSGVSYSWIAENGGHIVSGSTTTNPVVDAVGSYILTVTEPVNGCTVNDTVIVTEDKEAPENVTIVSGNSGVITCSETSLQLTASTTSTYPVSYSWVALAGGNIVSGSNTATPIVDKAGTYEVTVTNLATGCATLNNISVIEDKTLPSVSVTTPEPEKITCSAATVTLTGSSTTPGSTLLWTGPGNITNDASTNPVVDAAGSYTLTVTGPNGCTASKTVEVLQDFSKPAISVNTNPADLTCTNNTVTLEGSSTTPGAALTWTGPGILSGATTENPIVDVTGDYTLTVLHPLTGCADSKIVTVSENKILPDITFPVLPDTITCASPTVQVNAETSVANPSYQWSTLNGTITAGSTTSTATVSKEGTYSITITDMDNGCSFTKNIDVEEETTSPIVTIDPPGKLTCNSTQITLTSTSDAGNANIQWSTSTGNIVSGSSSYTPVVDQAGTYTLKVTNTANGCYTESSVAVTEDVAPPVISMNQNPDTLTCSQTTVQLNGTATDATLLWTGPAGANIQDETSSTPKVDKPGTYTLTATGLNGCVSSKTVIVQQNIALPQNISIISSGDLTCSQPIAELTASTTTGGSSFQWHTGTGGSFTTVTNGEMVMVDAPANYKVVVMHPTSRCVDSAKITVSQNTTIPTVTFAAVPDDITCASPTSNISATVDPAHDIQWTGPGNISDPTAANITVDKSGIYTIKINDPVNGCNHSETITVGENKVLPDVSVNVPGDLTCSQTTITLTGSSSVVNKSFSWSTTDGEFTNAGPYNNSTVNVKGAGNYQLTVTNNDNGCSNSKQVSVLQDIASPHILVDPVANNKITCITSVVNLYGTSTTPGVTFNWSGPGNITDENTETPAVDLAGIYTLKVTAPNGCFSEDNVLVEEDKTVPAAPVILTPDTLTCNQAEVLLKVSPTSSDVDYSWTTSGSGNISSPSDHETHVDDIGTYTVLATHRSSSCTNQSSVTVHENYAEPDINLDPGPWILTCAQPTATLSGSSTSGINPVWTASNGGHIVSGKNTFTPVVDAPGTYTLTVYDSKTGCAKSETVTVTRDASLPDIDIDPYPDQLTCVVTDVTLSGQPVEADHVHSWTASPGNIVSGAGSYNPVVNEPGTYIIEVTDPNSGCTSTAAIHVTENIQQPSLSVQAPDKLTCLVNQVQLSASSTNNDVTYSWTTSGDGIIKAGDETVQDPVVYSPASYTVEITDPANGCTNSSGVNVEIDTAKPTIDVDKTPDLLTCDVSSVILNGSSTTPDVNYSWTTTGTGSILNPSSTQPRVDDTGYYKLTVTSNSNGCSISDSVLVEENKSAPHIWVEPFPDTINCAVSEVQLKGSSTTAGVSYAWTGPGNISVPTAMEPFVDKPGIYTLTVKNVSNGCTSTADVTVHENKTIPTAPLVTSASNCYGNTTGTLSAVGSQVQWYTDASLAPAYKVKNGNTYTPSSYTKSGTYKFFTTQTDPYNHCESPAAEGTLTIHELPSPPIPVDKSVCDGLAVPDIEAHGTSINWYDGPSGNILGSGSMYSTGETIPGTYTFYATQTSSITGCESNTAPVTLTIHDIPDAPSITEPLKEKCQGETNPSFSASGTSVKWYSDATLSVPIYNGSTYLPTVSGTGNYNFYATQTSAEGCESTGDTATLTIKSNPTVFNVQPGGTFCEGEDGINVILENSETGVDYQLILDDATPVGNVLAGSDGNSLDFGPQNQAGIYTVKGYKNNGCTSMMQNGAAIIEDKLPLAAGTISGPVSACQGQTEEFSIPEIQYATSYKWNLPSGTSIVSGGNSNKITVYFSSSAENGSISARGSNSCGDGFLSPAHSITVNKLPAPVTDPISGPSEVCQGETGVTYSIPVVENSTSYIWTVPAGVTITGGNGTNSITVDFGLNETGGTFRVRGKNDCGLGNPSAGFKVTAKPLPHVEAGVNSQVCDDKHSLSGSAIPAGGNGEWTVAYGPATVANTTVPSTEASGLRMGENKFTWTISLNGCSNSDSVTIVNNKVDVDAGDDQIVCSRTTNLDAREPLTGGEWTVASGVGVIFNKTAYNSQISGLGQMENKFVWSVNKNGCISTDTVSITNDRPLTPNAGENQTLTITSTELDADIPESGTIGTWSVYSGGSNIVNIHDPKTEVTDLNMGVNAFRWTVTRNQCSLTDSVFIENATTEMTDAGPNQEICRDYTHLSANEPIVGIGEWTVVQGSAKFDDKNMFNTRTYDLAHGDNILKWTVKNSNFSSTYDTVIITNNSPTVANGGLDQSICKDSSAMAGNPVTYGNGTWTLISGSANIEDPSSHDSKVTGLSPGENKFRWKIVNANCETTDEVTIYNGTPTTASAGPDQNICDNSTILTPNTPTYGEGTWSVIAGSGKFSGNVVSDLAPDENILRWTITNGNCKSFDDVIITSNKPTTPHAGVNQSVCTDSLFLAANEITVGEGLWTLQSGSAEIMDTLDPATLVRSLSQGKNIFRWTVTYKGCVEFDEVEISYDLVKANAGKDQTLCADNTILEGNNAGPGTGSWSVLGTSSARFDDYTKPNTQVRNLQNGPNYLRWSIKNNKCTSYDDIVIHNDNPSEAFAGANRSVCSDSTWLEGSQPIHGEGKWTLLSGSAEIADTSSFTTPVKNLALGPNTFRWTISNNECASSSEVTITNNQPINVEAGTNQTVCSDSAELFANKPSIGTGHWSVLHGSATFADPGDFNTRAYKMDNGLNIFEWTVTSHDCSISDTIYVTSNMPTKAAAGADQILCENATTLSANNPVYGTGKWSVISGQGTISHPSDPLSGVTNIGLGTNKLRWTIDNNGCQSFDEIVIVNNLPTQADAGIDQVLCGDSTRLFANTPDIGTGSWMLVAGDGKIASANSNQTSVTELDFGENTFRWITMHKNCVSYDDVVITNNYAEVNAGVDENVYTSDYNLIGNKPLRGNGEWKLIAGSGTIVNPGSFETTVKNLGSGANTFKWNIENNGCVASDEVVITYYLMPVADFKPSSASGCPPMEVTFVNNSIGGAPYSWDFGDGSTEEKTNVAHTFHEPGTYIVTLTASAPGGKIVTKDTLITVHEPPKAEFEIAPDEAYIPGQHVRAYNYSYLADSSIWNFGDGNLIQETNPSYEYQDTGWFDVKLKVINRHGCTDSMILYDGVHVMERSKLIFPSAFTPNIYGPSGGRFNPNDKSNDVFYPIVVVGGVMNYKMRVFNRWGVLLFESEDISTGWDGYYKDEILPEDVYIYKVSGRYNNGEPFTIVGDVLLMRR